MGTRLKKSSYFDRARNTHGNGIDFNFNASQKKFTVPVCNIGEARASDWNRAIKGQGVSSNACKPENFTVTTTGVSCIGSTNEATLDLRIESERTVKTNTGGSTKISKSSAAQVTVPPCTEVKTQAIVFPDNRGKSGQFDGMDTDEDEDFGAKVNGKRIEVQTFRLDNTSDPVLTCNFNMNTSTKTFYYDDGFILTVLNARQADGDNDDDNGIELLSGRMHRMDAKTEDVEIELPTTKQRRRIRVRKMDYDRIKLDNYSGYEGCAVETKDYKDENRNYVKGCEVPPTEKKGRISFNPAPEQQMALASLLSPHRNGGRNELHFRLQTFGDNDPDIDCTHSELRFEVDMEYGIKAFR